MIINTFSYLWSATAVDAMVDLTRSGFRVFEVPVSSPHCWPDNMAPAVRSEARSRLQDCGAVVRSLNAGGYDINLASPAANMRRKSVDHIKDVIDLAFEWSVSDVVISPGTRRPMISPPLPQTLDWLSDSLDRLLPRAEQAGVRLLLENTPYCFRPTLKELAGVVTDVGHARLGIVYDVANAAYIGEDPVQELLTHHAAIGLVHVSDTGRDVWGHDPIGTGIVDFEALGRAVENTGKGNDVVLEIIRDENPLGEINMGLDALRTRGWTLSSLGGMGSH